MIDILKKKIVANNNYDGIDFTSLYLNLK